MGYKKRIAALCMAQAVLAAGYTGDTAWAAEAAASQEAETNQAVEAAAGQEAETNQIADSGIKLGITLYSLQNEYTVRFANAAADYAGEKGIELQIYDGNYDAELQINQVKQMLEDGVDGLILNPQEAVRCSECVDAAVEAGVPVIAVNTRVENDGITSYVGSDDVEAGEMIMERAAEALAGKGNVVILEGPLGQSAQLDRLQGMKNILKENPGIQVIGDKTANWSRLEAQTVMAKWLDTFDRIDAVVAENDDMALGAVQAIKDDGRIPGEDILVVSIDGSEDAQAAVQEGSILMTVYQNAEKQACVAIDVLLQALAGEEVYPEYQVPLTPYMVCS
ncbi:MAG: substrate-binding domain-containing protein [Lachnospiraceae bacterium]|nr:substrate-binding domain-containing protein [Lachnospiraceae bacterium]